MRLGWGTLRRRGDEWRPPVRTARARRGGRLAVAAVVATAALVAAGWRGAASSAAGADPLAGLARGGPGAGAMLAGDVFRDGPEVPRALVRIREGAVAGGDPIRLGEIADIEAADHELARRLAALPVGQAPLPGQARVLNVGTLRIRMRQAGLPEKEIAVVAPGFSFAIRSAGVTIPAGELERQAALLVERRLREQAGGAPPGEVVVRAEKVAEVVVPPGEVSFAVAAWPPLAARMLLPLQVLVDGQPVRTVPVRVEVAVRRRVPVAAADLPARTRLAPEHVRWEVRELSPDAQVPARPEDLEGRQVARSVPAGTVLTAALLEPAVDARAGDPVVLVAEVGGLTVEAPGVLLQDARWGQRVAARNTATGRIVEGRLEAGGRVRVTPGG